MTLEGLPARHGDHAMAAWRGRCGGGEKVQNDREEEGMVAVKVRSRVWLWLHEGHGHKLTHK